MLSLRKASSRLSALAVCCLMLALTCAAASAQTGYGIVDLGTLPGGQSSAGYAVNNTARRSANREPRRASAASSSRTTR